MRARSQHSKEPVDDKRKFRELRELRAENKLLKRKVAHLQRELEKLNGACENLSDPDPMVQQKSREEEQPNHFPHSCSGKPEIVEIVTAHRLIHICKTCQSRRALERKSNGDDSGTAG